MHGRVGLKQSTQLTSESHTVIVKSEAALGKAARLLLAAVGKQAGRLHAMGSI